jgi:acyl carrier protein
MVRETVWRIILELAPSSISTPSEDTRLVEDLGYHSLALLELAFALEDEFALPAMNAEQAQGISTILDVEKYVRTAQEGGPGEVTQPTMLPTAAPPHAGQA